MEKKYIIAVLVSALMLFCSVGVVASADDSVVDTVVDNYVSVWDYYTDWISQPVEWIKDYLNYNSRFDDKYSEGGHGGGGYHRSLENGIKDSVVYGPDPLEIESFNINECYSITGKFVTISGNGNKILYEVALDSYNYKLTSAPSASSDIWNKGGSVILKKTDMNTGLTTNYSFPAVLRGYSPFSVYSSSSSDNRNGLPLVCRINYWYLDGSTVRQATLYFGQSSDNNIQVYNLPEITGYDNSTDVTSGYSSTLLSTNCCITRSIASGSGSFQVAFCLSSLDTNDNTNANLVTEKYFGGGFGLAPVFVDNTYKAGNSYNVNNIAPELGFDYINGQLELNADVLGAKIDLALGHLMDLYNDFYSGQTAPYTSITEGDTYNYIEIIKEPEPVVTYPPSTGGGGGVPEEWLQHYPTIDTTPYMVATVPDLSYFEDNAVIPPATATIFTLISDFVVDGGFFGLFSITFILGIAMYFFRR